MADCTGITAAQASALKWLRARNGDGVFARDGVLLAAGERAPVMRATWNALEAAGLVERYARKRLRVTETGRSAQLGAVEESGG